MKKLHFLIIDEMCSHRIRKILRFKFFILFLSLVFVFSCSKDDDKHPQEDEITISVEDLTINIDEFPETNNLLGKVQAETNRGSLTYTLQEQNPHDALLINESTGELHVKNGLLFSFEQNPILTAIVKVSNEEIFENSNITINLNEPEILEYHKMIDKNNIWVDYSLNENGRGSSQTQRKIYLGEEELINGKEYFSLYSRVIDYRFGTQSWNKHDNSVGEEIFMFKIREDEDTKKVYALIENNTEVLLYDFALSVGDAIELWEPTSRSFINQTVIEVANITLLNGEARKKITFESGYSIIESIGFSEETVYRGGASIIGFFQENTLLFKNQYFEFEDNFWNEGNLAEINLEDFCIVDKKVLSRSNLISDGGNYVENNIIEKGICWSTAPNPTVQNNFTNEFMNEYGASTQVSDLKGFYTSVADSEFQPNVNFHLRSYTKNLNGIKYSDATHTLNSGFLSSSLFTTLLGKEFGDGSYLLHLKGGVFSNNFPGGAEIIEKGFAHIIWRNNDKPVHGPYDCQHYPVENGTVDNFELNTSFLRGSHDYGWNVAHYWSYVKFDNGVTVYGKHLVVSGD